MGIFKALTILFTTAIVGGIAFAYVYQLINNDLIALIIELPILFAMASIIGWKVCDNL